DLADWDKGKSALAWLADTAVWRDAGRTLQADAMGTWHLAAPAILLFGTLLITRRALRVRLSEIARLAAPIHTDRFGLTAEALFLTLLLAGFWPGVMGFVGWRLSQSVDAPDTAKALGAGLLSAATMLASL